MKNKIIFLSGLNGIRAIAAFGVMIAHININLGMFNINNFSVFGYNYRDSKNSKWILAEHGVTMFFVLSGFLITFLLIKEYKIKNEINIKSFYLRRILRIWPLYFFYVLLTLVTLYIISSFKIDYNIIYYLTLFPNIPFINSENYPAMYHLWSIGVEEQFYLFWPFLFVLLINKKFINKLMILILMLSIFRILIWYLHPFSKVAILSVVNRFDCMFFGALGAYLYYNNSKIIDYINSKFFQFFCWTVLILVILNLFSFFNSIIEIFVIELITIGIIIGQIKINNRIFNLENKLFSYIGKISFGIYVYHPLLILIFSSFLKYENQLHIWLYTLFVFILISVLTIVISHISYFYFEKRFIKLKSKFSIIHSTNERPDI